MSSVNQYDNLNYEEEKSDEESSMGDSTRDFIVDESRDGVQDQTAGQLVQSSDTLANVDASNVSGVSIFNTSVIEQVNEEKESGADRNVVNALRKRFAAGTAPNEGPRMMATMSLGDLNQTNSIPGTTVTVETSNGQNEEPPPGGQRTTADGFAGGAPGFGGVTRTLHGALTAGAPPGRDHPGESATLDQRPLFHQDKKPQVPDRSKKAKGGVDMKWEMNWDKEGEKEASRLSIKDQWGAERTRLQLEEALSVEDVEVALLKAQEWAAERSAHLRRGDEDWLATSRQKLKQEYSEEGTLIPMLLVDAEDWEVLDLSRADLLPGLTASFQGDWELLSLSKGTSFEQQDVFNLLEKVSELLPKWARELAKFVGPEEVEKLIERHSILAKGLLSGTAVTREAAKLFPQEAAGDIVEWYLRFVTALLELERLRGMMDSGLGQLGLFLDKYPGPTQVTKPEDMPWRNSRLGEQGEGRRRAGLALSVSSRSEAPCNATTPVRKSKATEQEQRQPLGVQDAAYLGYLYKDQRPEPELQPSGQRFVSMMSGATPRTLDESRIKPRSKGAGYEGSLQRGSGSANHSRDDEADGGASEDSELVSLAGFSGMYRQDIMNEVTEYVTQKLTEFGSLSTLTVDTLVKNLPRMGLLTRRGHEQSGVSSFQRIVKTFNPYSSGSFISVPEWWKMLNGQIDDLGWSLAMRIRFLGRTGGLAAKVNESCRVRVMDLINKPEVWLPDYEAQRSEEDHRYWLYQWINVGLKIIQEFHTVQESEVIEEGLQELFKKDKYTFTSKTNPLNADFYRVCLLWQDMNQWLIERSSDLVNSPLYVWKLLKGWLEKVGVVICGEGSANVGHLRRADCPAKVPGAVRGKDERDSTTGSWPCDKRDVRDGVGAPEDSGQHEGSPVYGYITEPDE